MFNQQKRHEKLGEHWTFNQREVTGGAATRIRSTVSIKSRGSTKMCGSHRINKRWCPTLFGNLVNITIGNVLDGFVSETFVLNCVYKATNIGHHIQW
jgi:hypothetical protein